MKSAKLETTPNSLILTEEKKDVHNIVELFND